MLHDSSCYLASNASMAFSNAVCFMQRALCDENVIQQLSASHQTDKKAMTVTMHGTVFKLRGLAVAHWAALRFITTAILGSTYLDNQMGPEDEATAKLRQQAVTLVGRLAETVLSSVARQQMLYAQDGGDGQPRPSVFAFATDADPKGNTEASTMANSAAEAAQADKHQTNPLYDQTFALPVMTDGEPGSPTQTDLLTGRLPAGAPNSAILDAANAATNADQHAHMPPHQHSPCGRKANLSDSANVLGAAPHVERNDASFEFSRPAPSVPLSHTDANAAATSGYVQQPVAISAAPVKSQSGQIGGNQTAAPSKSQSGAVGGIQTAAPGKSQSGQIGANHATAPSQDATFQAPQGVSTFEQRRRTISMVTAEQILPVLRAQDVIQAVRTLICSRHNALR